MSSNKTGMFGEVMLVDKSIAARWLETVPLDWQRNSRPHRIAEYAEAMRAGKWALTHQGIGFDTSGVLRDGSHRLKAVVMADAVVEMFVVRNAPDESFVYADDNLPRSTRDAIRMASMGDYTCSIISTAITIESLPASVELGRIPKPAIIERIKKHWRALEFSEDNAKAVLGCTRAVRALIARAFYTSDNERLAEFCNVLRTGMVTHPSEDSAAVVFRNFIMKRTINGAAAEVEKYRKGQTALRNFLDRKKMDRIGGSELDLFPLPEN